MMTGITFELFFGLFSNQISSAEQLFYSSKFICNTLNTKGELINYYQSWIQVII